jgi:MFS family permease
VTRASWAAWIALLIFTMGTSIVTPLFPLYQDRFDLSNGQITMLFAIYSITVVPTLLLMGSVSDRVGRRRVILPAMAIITAASLVMGFTESVPLLYLGRILQGVAIGGMLGVATAFVVDHARSESKAAAAALAGLAFRLGFGLGPGLAGLVAQYASDPIHRPFQLHALLMLVALGAVLAAPETIRRRPLKIEINVGVPAGQFRAFATFLAPAAFLMSFLDATLLSVVPLYMANTLGVDNLALIGLVGFLILGMGGFTPFIFRGLDPRRAVMIGVATSSLASLAIVSAASLGSVALVIGAAAVIGLLNGLILQGGTTIGAISVPIEERGKLLSALYMCAYSGTIPVVALGYLADRVGLTMALGVFSLVALALATFILTVGRQNFRAVVPYRKPVPEPA